MSVLDRWTSRSKGSVNEEVIQDDDPLYTANLEPRTPEPGESDQDAASQPGDIPQYLQKQLDNMEKRLRDKDRVIQDLRTEVLATSKMLEKFPHLSGTTPEEEDRDPVFLDEDTQRLFEKRFQENPAEATLALLEYQQNRFNEYQQKVREETEQERKRREEMETQRNFIQQTERRMFEQLQKAEEDFGEEARKLREDLQAYNESGGQSYSELAEAIAKDPALPMTRTGLYDYVAKKLTGGYTMGQDEETYVPPGVRGAARPQPGYRRTATPREEQQESYEDKVRRAIRQAKRPGQKADDRAVRRFVG